MYVYIYIYIYIYCRAAAGAQPGANVIPTAASTQCLPAATGHCVATWIKHTRARTHTHRHTPCLKTVDTSKHKQSQIQCHYAPLCTPMAH